MKRFFIAFKMTAFALLAEILFYFLLVLAFRKYNWIVTDSELGMRTVIISTFIFILMVRLFLDRKIKDSSTSLIFYFLSIAVVLITMGYIFGIMVTIACAICYFFNYVLFKGSKKS